tara:strand:- start:4148 stop:4330 length:183 start_codon:yes stop_codon:yes gene_type:complete
MTYNVDLEQLKDEHARLHIALEKLVAESNADDVRIAVMKKRKLWIKDKITQAENNQAVTS